MKNIFPSTALFFQILTLIITSYYLILSFFGFSTKKITNAVQCKPQKKFALIVAAHNEELVIAQIIESLKNIDYPKELYDIFVIADNCSDNTAIIAGSCGAKVFERNIPQKKGKGYALEWMFKKICRMNAKYDAAAVFDADNLVSRNFLKEMNCRLCSGYRVVQGYIDSKNPIDSWITQSYSISFWTANRLFQLSRHNLGLSNQIGGTGFCVDMNTIKQIGWGTACLTEDLEFTCKLVLNGHKVGWAHKAVVYDEKPITLRQSWKQRKRWMQGFTDVASRFFFKLMKKAFKEHNFTALDCALYTIQPFVTLLISFSALLTFIMTVSKNGFNINAVSSIISLPVLKAYDIFQFLLIPFVLVLENKLSKKMFTLFCAYSANIFILNSLFKNYKGSFAYTWINLLCIIAFILFLSISDNKLSLKLFIWYLLYSLYTLTWIPIIIEGILQKNNKEWEHTKHTRVLNIQDME